MKKGLSKAVSFCMMIGLLAQSLYIPAMAEEAATEIAAESDTDTSLVGTLAFAQCEEYINIRESASTDSAVTAKIYNNGSATIEEQDGDWYKIRSGNAEGYVKAEYFVTGEAADAVAQKAAYNVAMVHPTDLNIRSDANEDSEVLATAHEKDELEVVAWDGDWMKVALGGDVYGYVNAYYVDYKTYYPTAETIEEEQARLSAEQEAAEAADYEVSDDTAETLPEETYEEPTVDDSSDTEEASYPDDSDETTWTEAPATDETVWKHRRPRHRTQRRRKQKRRTRRHRRPRRLRHLALVSRSRILPCSMSATHMYGAGQVLQKGQTVPDLYRPYLQISGCICPELQSPSLTAAHQLAWTICSRVICCSIIRPEASTM